MSDDFLPRARYVRSKNFVRRHAAEGRVRTAGQRPMPARASLPVSKTLRNTHSYLSDRTAAR